MPVFGLNNGMVPIIAYNYGARKKERILQTIKTGAFIAIGVKSPTETACFLSGRHYRSRMQVSYVRFSKNAHSATENSSAIVPPRLRAPRSPAPPAHRPKAPKR